MKKSKGAVDRKGLQFFYCSEVISLAKMQKNHSCCLIKMQTTSCIFHNLYMVCSSFF